MKLQFKTIDYKTLGEEEHTIKMEDFAKAKNVRIRGQKPNGEESGKPGVVWDSKKPNCVRIKGGLMVNGNYEHGFYKVGDELV